MAIDAYVEANPGVSRDEAARGIRLQDRVAPHIDDLQDAIGGVASGAWFDANDGGRLKLGVATTSPGRVENPAVSAILRARALEGDVVLGAQRVDLRTLQTGLSDVNDRLHNLIAAGKASTELDLPSNAIVIQTATTLTAADVEQVDGVRSSLSVPIRIQQTDDASLIVRRRACDNPVYVTCDRPLRGGPRIFTDNTNKVCTAGFNAEDGTGHPYLVTAGHCVEGDGGDAWRTVNPGTGTFDIGTSTGASTYGGVGDFGSIRLFTDSHWYRFPPAGIVFVGSSPYNNPRDPATVRDETYPIYGRATSSEGQVLCFTSGIRLSDGRFTDCGTVRAVDSTQTYDDGTTIHNLGVLGTESVVEGASGGPVYKNGNGYGIISGYNEDTYRMFYQGLTDALTRLALHLPDAGT